MRFSFSSIIRIVFLFFVLLTISVTQLATSKALGRTIQMSTLHNSLNSTHPVSAKEKLHSTILRGISTLPTFFQAASHPPCNPCGSGDLKYQGGSAVELQPKAYAIFWGSNWKNSSGNLTQDGQIVQKYFSDVGGTKFENILTQYYMQNQDGSQSYIQNTLQFDATHIWIDTSTPPNSFACAGNTVEDSAIQTEVEKIIKKRGWPQADPSATFFVYTPPNWAIRFPAPFPFWYEGCSNLVGAGFGGYHWMNPVTLTRYAPIVYPNKNYFVPKKPNGNIYGDSLANATSHEQFEAITDPRPYDGWADSNTTPAEIGDKCAWNFPTSYTKLNNGGVFELQKEYSDATHSCVNTFTPHLTVNTTADFAPPCAIATYSLRCAITQVNTDGSGKPIWFNIPSSDSGCKLTTIQGQSVYVCTITPTSDIPQLFASNITIDGYTQPGAQKNTLTLGNGDNAILTIRIDGSNGVGGLVLNNGASHDTIQGLEITNFQPYGLLVNTSSDTNNTIDGNFVGTDGINALGNGAGIYLGGGASNNVVGGQTPDQANLVSGNPGQGIIIGAGSGNIIEGNYVGTDISGTAALHGTKGRHVSSPLSGSGIPNGTGILVFAQAGSNEIGGTMPASANIIAHNTYGVVTDNSSFTDTMGNNINSNFIGVFIQNGETYDSVSGNSIASNSDAGILVGNSSTDHVNVEIKQNSIFSNGGLGIDLYPSDVINCTTSTSGGPNDYTPCPVITSATTTQVSGTATACANSTFVCRIEVYVATNEPDDQGHGEGMTFLGSVNTDSNGNWSLNVPLSSGTIITATSTVIGPDETSEFAANVTVS